MTVAIDQYEHRDAYASHSVNKNVVTKNLYWLKVSKSACYAVTYLSKNNGQNSHEIPTESPIENEVDEIGSEEVGSEEITRGFIVLPTLGHEYNHSHRAITYMCEQITLQGGAACLRLDLSGTGDSPGDEISEFCIEEWSECIESAISELKIKHGTRHITIIGYRFGGLMAAYFAKKIRDIQCVLIWNPYTNGAAFFRDMEIIGRNQPGWLDAPDNVFDAGGCIFSRAAQKRLSGIALELDNASHVQELHVLQPEERPLSKRLFAKLSGVIGKAYQTLYLGNNEFQKAALVNTVPLDAIEKILRSLATCVKNESTPLIENDYSVNINTPTDSTLELKTGSRIDSQIESNNVVERIVVIPETGAVGVLTEPDGAKPTCLLILLNGGASHHVGPSRLYVNLARFLVSKGYAVLRADLPALGDGACATQKIEQRLHPFPQGCLDDIKSVIDVANKNHRYQQVSLGGLCSAGLNGFQYQLAQQDKRINMVLAINPTQLYWREGQSYLPYINQKKTVKRQVKTMLKALFSWRLAGSLKRYLITIFHELWLCVTSILCKAFNFLTLYGKRGNTFTQDLTVLQSLGTRIAFFISKNEPGLSYIKRLLGVRYRYFLSRGYCEMTVLPDADHAFVLRQQQIHLYAGVEQKLKIE